MPGLEIKSTFPFNDHEPKGCQQHLITYGPGDATHYEVSLTWARFAPLSSRFGQPDGEYLQFSVWSPSPNGTMLIEFSRTHGSAVEDLDRIEEMLRCSPYSARVFSLLIHGCLTSHDLREAQHHIKHFRSTGRLGFVDPDAA